MTNVKSAIITVTEMFAVAVAAKGTRPNRFRKRMKKKAVTMARVRPVRVLLADVLHRDPFRTNGTSISTKL